MENGQRYEKSEMTRKERAERRKDMAELVRQGWKTKAVARKFLVTQCTVSNACHEFGVPVVHTSGTNTRKPKMSKTKLFRVIAALLNTDKTVGQIATETRVAECDVVIALDSCREAGIRVREWERPVPPPAPEPAPVRVEYPKEVTPADRDAEQVRQNLEYVERLRCMPEND